MNVAPIRLLVLTFFFTLIAWNTATTAYSAPSVSASLNYQQLPIDMTAVLTIKVDGVRSVDVNIPEVKNLRFHKRGQSSQIQMINGSFSASVSAVYLVEPLAVGKYTIPAISVHCDGEKLLTKPISFEVTNGGSTDQSAGKGTDNEQARIGSGDGSKITFLKIQPGKRSVYPGEIIPIRIEAYFNQKIQANLDSLPTLTGDGFVMSPLSDKPSRTMKNINNSRYIVLVWDSFLTGIKEGDHKLSFELAAELLIPQQSRMSSRFRNQGFFRDDFFSDFFQDYQSKTVKIISPELDMQTKPLPSENQPKEFSGAIGSFNMRVTASPTEVELGEPITLTMTIKGEGNFDRVEVPCFPATKEWKQYTPSSKFIAKQGGPAKGVKKFEQAVVPKGANITAIPALTFVYFDPIEAQYKRLSSQPIPLTIRQEDNNQTTGSSEPQLAKINKTADSSSQGVVQANIKGLAPIQLDLGSLQPSIQPLFSKIWFICLLILLIGILCGLSLIRLYQRRQENNPDIRRRSLMKKSLHQNLRVIELSKKQGDTNAFLIACRVAIQKQLGLSWGIEGTAITLADLEKRLGSDSNFIVIFSMADKACYGGHSLSVEEMQQLYSQLKDDLVELV